MIRYDKKFAKRKKTLEDASKRALALSDEDAEKILAGVTGLPDEARSDSFINRLIGDTAPSDVMHTNGHEPVKPPQVYSHDKEDHSYGAGEYLAEARANDAMVNFRMHEERRKQLKGMGPDRKGHRGR